MTLIYHLLPDLKTREVNLCRGAQLLTAGALCQSRCPAPPSVAGASQSPWARSPVLGSESRVQHSHCWWFISNASPNRSYALGEHRGSRGAGGVGEPVGEAPGPSQDQLGSHLHQVKRVVQSVTSTATQKPCQGLPPPHPCSQLSSRTE